MDSAGFYRRSLGEADLFDRPTISLDGRWQCSPDWESSTADNLPAGLFEREERLPATVPGTIHTDLMAAGKIADPFRDDLENQIQWISEIAWRYQRTFDVDDIFLTSESIVLWAEGLDTFASIFINGKNVGVTENMFIPYAFEVRHLLRRHRNKIEIVFDSPLHRIRHLEERFHVPDTVMKFPRIFARKAQYSFGWDWGPTLITSGIWRSIQLIAFDRLKLKHLHIRQMISPALDHAKVIIDVECSGSCSQPLNYEVTISGPDCELSSYSSSKHPKYTVEFEIKEPHLWWPHGLGEQPLYDVTVRVDADGVHQFGFKRQIGLRHIELITEPDTQGETFRLQVNNVPVFCRGVNWIPSDSFIPRVTTTKLRRLLSMARDAGINMIRIWGGGIYESSEFYSICDEFGLMVWQDFMFACATYPEHDEFFDNVQHEVEIVVRELRDHPSIVLWCGNNENEQDWYKYLHRPYAEMVGHRIFDDIIPHILLKEDPSRPYRQSSPFGGEDPNAEDFGTRHQWNMWSNWASPASVHDDRSRFVTEFGFQAPACLKTWHQYIREDELWPQSKVVEHHNKQIRGMERLYCYMAEQFQVPSAFADFVLVSQVVQAEALKMCVEHWRSQKFLTSGAIIWQLNDCWPVTSWSLIDGELRPKAAYWYSKRFFAPILLVIRQKRQNLDLFAVNDTRTGFSGRLVVSTFELHGKQADLFEETVSIPANKSTVLASWKLEEFGLANASEEYIRAQLICDEKIIAKNRYFFLPCKHLRISAPTLKSRLSRLDESNWSFEVVSDRFVKALQVELPENEWQLSDNFVDVDAGETVRFDILACNSEAVLETVDIAMSWIEQESLDFKSRFADKR